MATESIEKKPIIEENNVEINNEKVFSNSAVKNEDVLELDTDERHSLLDSHDLLLDNSDHSLLEDNDNHDLLTDVPSDQQHMLFNRHREMMSNISNNHNLLQHSLPMKNSLVSEFGALENREQMFGLNDHPMVRPDTKELLMLRERHQNEMQLRQNELLARQNHSMMEQHKPYLNNVGLDTSQDSVLNFNQLQNTNILPPFGMRMDGTVPQNFGMLQQNSRSNGVLDSNHLLNGYGNDVSHLVPEGRYVGENSMDRFFLDFHRNQQMKGSGRTGPLLPPEAPSLAYIEGQHRQALQRKYGMMQNGLQDGMGKFWSLILLLAVKLWDHVLNLLDHLAMGCE